MTSSAIDATNDADGRRDNSSRRGSRSTKLSGFTRHVPRSARTCLQGNSSDGQEQRPFNRRPSLRRVRYAQRHQCGDWSKANAMHLRV